ncbi:ABC transporter substrate-binding protein [Nostoc sp. UHCC 0252]|uniref:ABC transporter substrate-binding protein n=1 Tax=Nostoc sp. UHCC 0252 TaxID=3110241 RepID=UPI002B1F41FC|nr:ABC transporter substrate-binding protein [Nostoc sp. UHCC 0252]MEA5600698.1 ABC transporter substrate-binding protein [Nostoc sp. UHCC 0252]
MDNQLKVIQEQLAKDSDLLNELYNQERCEINPRRKLQLKQEIEQLNQNMRDRENQIEQRKQELKAKENQPETQVNSVESSPPKSDILPIVNNSININRYENVIRRPLIKRLLIIIGCITIGLLLATLVHQNTSDYSNTLCPNLKENININLPSLKSLSCGEKYLISGSILTDKIEGVKAYQKNDYQNAITLLQNARDKEPNDPETLIYLNNARIERYNIAAYTIAVVVPISSNLYTSLQILRGVAQAQEEFLSKEKYQPKIGLKVLIADDANKVEEAQKIASILVEQKHIFAVIGHYASDLTLKTRDIYEKGEFVSVSPGSTSAELPRPNDHFFFRTIPSLERNTIAVARYLESKKKYKVAVFYNPSSDFSKSFLDKLKKNFSDFNIEIINELEDKDKYKYFHLFHLSNPFFKPSKAIEYANAKGVKAFVVIPDGGTTDYSLRNTFKLIKASPKDFVIVGANPLFTDETLLLGEDVKDRLVVTTPWIQTTVSQSNFANQAKELWQGREISSWAVTAYDAAEVLIQALFTNIKEKPTRINLRDNLASPNFEAKGADETDKIKFENGNRKKEKVELAKIIKSKCSEFGYTFVPQEYQEQDIKQLESSCNL